MPVAILISCLLFMLLSCAARISNEIEQPLLPSDPDADIEQFEDADGIIDAIEARNRGVEDTKRAIRRADSKFRIRNLKNGTKPDDRRHDEKEQGGSPRSGRA